MRRIAIVARGPVSMPHFWPSADELWAVKYMGLALPKAGYKVDRVFFLDDLELYFKEDCKDGTYEALTKDWPLKDVILFVSNPPDGGLLPHMQRFSFPAVAEKFNSDYINESTSMALAQAGLELQPGDEIHLHGVDHSPDGELMTLTKPEAKNLIRHAQCVGYWIGRLEGMGIKIKINPISPCCDKWYQTRAGFRARGLLWKDAAELPTTIQSIYQDGKRLWEEDNLPKRALRMREHIHDIKLAQLSPEEIEKIFTSGPASLGEVRKPDTLKTNMLGVDELTEKSQ